MPRFHCDVVETVLHTMIIDAPDEETARRAAVAEHDGSEVPEGAEIVTIYNEQRYAEGVEVEEN